MRACVRACVRTCLRAWGVRACLRETSANNNKHVSCLAFSPVHNYNLDNSVGDYTGIWYFYFDNYNKLIY